MRNSAPFQCTIIADRLSFEVNSRSAPPQAGGRINFCIDGHREFRYQPFNNDFGPFSLPVIYRFCQRLLRLLHDERNADQMIVFHTSAHDKRQLPNTTFLIGAFQILYLGRTPQEAFAPLAPIASDLMPFRDAGYGSCTYELTVLDCLLGIYQGFIHGFFDFSNFDDAEWEFYEQVENGDFNWLVPGRFLAFAGPHKTTNLTPGQYPRLAPSHYFGLFKERGIEHIVRLNKPIYERRDFIKAGFNHHELFFTDGSCPPEHILQSFLDLCRTSDGAIAVHCKAGLGRTGSLIACFMMEEYRFTAPEAIAWLRLARPGCVIGPQQYYLHQKQDEMWANGKSRGVQRKTRLDKFPSWVLQAGLLIGEVADDMDAMTLGSASSPYTPEKSSPLPESAVRRLSVLSSASDVTVGSDDEADNGDAPSQGDYLNARKLFRNSKGLRHTTSAFPLSARQPQCDMERADSAVFV